MPMMIAGSWVVSPVRRQATAASTVLGEHRRNNSRNAPSSSAVNTLRAPVVVVAGAKEEAGVSDMVSLKIVVIGGRKPLPCQSAPPVRASLHSNREAGLAINRDFPDELTRP